LGQLGQVFTGLLKNSLGVLRPFDFAGLAKLRACTEFIEMTNGAELKKVEKNPFMLSLVEACPSFSTAV
jgi:hypothetical protein